MESTLIKIFPHAQKTLSPCSPPKSNISVKNLN
jgi:hypothetical protein